MENIELIKPNSIHTFQVGEQESGTRLDTYIAGQFPSYSRTFFNKLISGNYIRVNGAIVPKKSIVLKEDDCVQVQFPPKKERKAVEKRDFAGLDVSIVYEHPHFLIVNKPAGLMVHAPNRASDAITLVDWLLAHIEGISDVGHQDRPGIVHRLDKDTSGLLVIPKNDCTHAFFGDLFRAREIKKTYLAIVKGHPSKEGVIEFSIARHPSTRNRMTHVNSGKQGRITGKIREAVTHYCVLEYFEDCALVEVKPVTGRTHQIRVHFAAIGHPLLGDTVYGNCAKEISRQALHAHKLEFSYEGKKYLFAQDVPKDFKEALTLLSKNKS